MITGLYETHINVRQLEASIAFYKNVLNLKLAHIDQQRRIAFLWIGEAKESMLGLWEEPNLSEHRHFAFRCEVNFILNEAVRFLAMQKIKPYNFLKDGTTRPMVFAWMPAVSIYFHDPDGNELEFIGLLDGKSRPELGVISYEEWMNVD